MSQKTTKFEIVTPERTLLSEEIIQVTIPTQEGQITVLPDHSPLVSILKPGVLELKKSDTNLEVMSIHGGFVEVLSDRVVILADAAEKAHEIDEKKAEEARQQAEKTLQETRSEDKERFANITAQLEKELAKTKTVQRWRQLHK